MSLSSTKRRPRISLNVASTPFTAKENRSAQKKANERTNEPTNERTNEPTNERTNERQRTNGIKGEILRNQFVVDIELLKLYLLIIRDIPRIKHALFSWNVQAIRLQFRKNLNLFAQFRLQSSAQLVQEQNHTLRRLRHLVGKHERRVTIESQQLRRLLAQQQDFLQNRRIAFIASSARSAQTSESESAQSSPHKRERVCTQVRARARVCVLSVGLRHSSSGCIAMRVFEQRQNIGIFQADKEIRFVASIFLSLQS